MQLIIDNNDGRNPLTLDLTRFIDVQRGDGLDPYDPAFSDKVFSRSLLREGGTLALESLKLKELVFPLKLSQRSAPQLAVLVAEINQVLASGSATCSWQDDGLSQATIFDLASGQMDIEYDYRMAQKFWLSARLRLFAQPLGRTLAPRPYAVASGVGPLLMISPYASSGQNILAATNSGLGGVQQPSGGVFYPDDVELNGDATARLQISYVGPLPKNSARSGAQAGVTPTVVVSLLPDEFYHPLIPAVNLTHDFGSTLKTQATSVASQYLSIYNAVDNYYFTPAPAGASTLPTTAWEGNHRLYAIARASNNPIGILHRSTVATVANGDWALYGLDVFPLVASRPTTQREVVRIAGTTSGAFDLAALVMLPDNAWAFNPYAVPLEAQDSLGWTNTIVLDDWLSSSQGIYLGATQSSAPDPSTMVASSVNITPYTRGLVPRPDPGDGIPIIAILGVGQFSAFDVNGFGATWSNQQTLQTMVSVNVLERTRYVFP